MVNQNKIITMTKLAIYYKHDGYSDRQTNDYFRHDYIYKKNLGTRLAVGFGGIIILGFYWLQHFLEGDVNIFGFDITDYLLESILFILAIVLVYTVIGTIQGTREYYLVQKRIKNYEMLTRELEKYEAAETATVRTDSAVKVSADKLVDKAVDRTVDVPMSRPPRARIADDSVVRAGARSSLVRIHEDKIQKPSKE